MSDQPLQRSESDVQKFRAAHAAWKSATDAYEAKMRGLLEGGPPIRHEDLMADCAELDRLRNDFIAASAPFVSWR